MQPWVTTPTLLGSSRQHDRGGPVSRKLDPVGSNEPLPTHVCAANSGYPGCHTHRPPQDLTQKRDMQTAEHCATWDTQVPTLAAIQGRQRANVGLANLRQNQHMCVLQKTAIQGASPTALHKSAHANVKTAEHVSSLYGGYPRQLK